MRTEQAAKTETSDAVERRRSRRIPCKGSAEGLSLQPNFMFRGEILDISLTGCFVSTKARLPLSAGTEVELRFRVEGRNFRLYAHVSHFRAGQGAGLEFFFEDEKSKDSHRALIATLEAAEQPKTASATKH